MQPNVVLPNFDPLLSIHDFLKGTRSPRWGAAVVVQLGEQWIAETEDSRAEHRRAGSMQYDVHRTARLRKLTSLQKIISSCDEPPTRAMQIWALAVPAIFACGFSNVESGTTFELQFDMQGYERWGDNGQTAVLLSVVEKKQPQSASREGILVDAKSSLCGLCYEVFDHGDGIETIKFYYRDRVHKQRLKRSEAEEVRRVWERAFKKDELKLRPRSDFKDFK